jgi:hypothetical protein
MTGSNKPGELITVVFGLCRMPFILAQNFKDTGFPRRGQCQSPGPAHYDGAVFTLSYLREIRGGDNLLNVRIY